MPDDKGNNLPPQQVQDEHVEQLAAQVTGLRGNLSRLFDMMEAEGRFRLDQAPKLPPLHPLHSAQASTLTHRTQPPHTSSPGWNPPAFPTCGFLATWANCSLFFGQYVITPARGFPILSWIRAGSSGSLATLDMGQIITGGEILCLQSKIAFEVDSLPQSSSAPLTYRPPKASAVTFGEDLTEGQVNPKVPILGNFQGFDKHYAEFEEAWCAVVDVPIATVHVRLNCLKKGRLLVPASFKGPKGVRASANILVDTGPWQILSAKSLSVATISPSGLESTPFVA
ncbi:hypothetical protein PCANC_19953 [Puccinia coronata f. sp. avenae]|uniref:Uncharacterized protein n=1 Tax=Puccinia coronata f. sp. avenae TaxID=200324 RepID=A0A2N5SKW2_9BASI|nr:hypothetical protein PCANC_19953 [Puccinia coronata f. sp. avenae]